MEGVFVVVLFVCAAVALVRNHRRWRESERRAAAAAEAAAKRRAEQQKLLERYNQPQRVVLACAKKGKGYCEPGVRGRIGRRKRPREPDRSPTATRLDGGLRPSGFARYRVRGSAHGLRGARVPDRPRSQPARELTTRAVGANLSGVIGLAVLVGLEPTA